MGASILVPPIFCTVPITPGLVRLCVPPAESADADPTGKESLLVRYLLLCYILNKWKETSGMADFSTNLRNVRKKRAFSQDSLAEKLGVSRQTVSSWERGNSYPDLEMLVRISEVLHTDPNELLYPPVKGEGSDAGKMAPASCFGKIATVIFIIGLLWGLSAGSQGYSPSPGVAGWHFVLSDACGYWIAAFLIGMIFAGIDKTSRYIIALLREIRDRE